MTGHTLGRKSDGYHRRRWLPGVQRFSTLPARPIDGSGNLLAGPLTCPRDNQSRFLEVLTGSSGYHVTFRPGYLSLTAPLCPGLERVPVTLEGLVR